MTNYSFTKIDVPAAAGTYTYIGVSGLDASGDAVGYYGNVDGDGDGTFHGFIALGNAAASPWTPLARPTPALALPQAGSSSETIHYLNNQYGFVDNGGVFLTFDGGNGFPPVPVGVAISTNVDGVTDTGVIYGELCRVLLNTNPIGMDSSTTMGSLR